MVMPDSTHFNQILKLPLSKLYSYQTREEEESVLCVL